MKAVRMLVLAALAVMLTTFGIGSVASAAAAPTPYPPPSCPLLTVSTTTPFPGQTITVGGTNFTPHVAVTIELDTNVTLGHATADGSGNFSVPVKLPAGVTGSHLIHAVGTGLGDCPVDPIQISVQGAGASGSSSGGGLASTGVDILTGIAVALALIGGGVLFARGGRRRHRHS